MNICHRHPSMTKKFQIFGGVSRRAGRAWDGHMGWERVDAPRRGRRGDFARRAVVEPTSGPSGCGWDNGRGQVGAGGRMVGADVPGGPSPARNAAGRPTTEPRAGVGCRRARGTRAPTNVGVLIRQGQPTWETRADTPRRGRLGDFARRAVGGRLWIWPWVGCWSTAAPGPAATSAALPCGRGCNGRGISRRSNSEVKSRIPKPAAGGPQLCGPQDLIAEAMTPLR